MRTQLILLFAPLFPLLICNTPQLGKMQAASTVIVKSKTQVVMELFTSQGCSSCPPADRLLGRTAKDSNVIALSYHVDYWNNLGWKDPFSSADNSARQRMYASLGDTYTPQLVINGEHEMVGSDVNKINGFRNTTEPLRPGILKINEAVVKDGIIHIRFSCSMPLGKNELIGIVVQDQATTSIVRGENRGLTLTNYNIVRSFSSIPKVREGENQFETLSIQGVQPGHLSFVILMQDKNSNKIITAVKANVK